jgi:hypothetical protein
MKEDFRKRTYLYRETMTLASMQVLAPTALSPVGLVFPRVLVSRWCCRDGIESEIQAVPIST